MMLNKVANIEIDIQSSIQCCVNEVLLFNVHPRWDSLRMGGARWSSEVFAASGVDDGPATYTITRERQLKFI